MSDSEFLARLNVAAATGEPISLANLHEVALFRSLPIEQRKQIHAWLGAGVPLWNGDCVRCDGPLQYANDSYDTRTYTRVFRCPACGWRDEQPTDEPTMSELLSQLHREEALAKRVAVTDQAALAAMPELSAAAITDVTRNPEDTQARRRFADWLEYIGRSDVATSIRNACTNPLPTHWERSTIPFDAGGWYGPVVELLGDLRRDIVYFNVAQGFVDFVAMNAGVFLERADDLFTRAPIRSVDLLDAGPLAHKILRSPHALRLVGIGLEAPMVHDTPPLPRLRHFALHSRHELTLAELTELAHAPALESATCVHLRTPPLDYSDDSDYITSYGLSDYGGSVRELASQTRRRWLGELLRPVLSRCGLPPS